MKLLMMPIAAVAALPTVLLVASIVGAVTFQWWMLVGLLPAVLLK